MPASDADSLSIQRLQARYLVCAPATEAARVRELLDRSLQHHLRIRLSEFNTSAIAHGEGLWLVRRLELDLHLDVAEAPDALGKTCALAIARELTREIAAGDTANVVYFPSRTDYLARFIIDCATGDAWSRWYHRRQEGLRLLGTSSAIRTALTTDISEGLRALERLLPEDRKRLIAALSAVDADMLLGQLITVPDAVPSARIWLLCLKQWRDSRHLPAASIAHRALLIFTAALAEQSADAGGGGESSIAAPLRTAARVLAWLHSNRQAAFDSGVLAPLLTSHGTLGSAEVLQLIALMNDAERPAARSSRHRTDFGGGFLLLDALDEFPVEALAQDWPALGATPAAALLRLMLLAACFGRARFGACFRDCVWRELLGVPASITLAQVHAWLTRLSAPRRRRVNDWLRAQGFKVAPRVADAARTMDTQYLGTPANAWHCTLLVAAQGVLREFARRIPGFGESQLEYLYANFLAIGADIETEESRRIILLERACLNLMLNVAGLNRGTRHPAWIPGRPLTLFSHG
jgi:hypothetical protein